MNKYLVAGVAWAMLLFSWCCEAQTTLKMKSEKKLQNDIPLNNVVEVFKNASNQTCRIFKNNRGMAQHTSGYYKGEYFEVIQHGLVMENGKEVKFESGEEIIGHSGNEVFTVAVLWESNQRELRKYTINNAGLILIKKNRIEGIELSISFLNGIIVVMDTGEGGGGSKVEFYSSEFSLLNTYVPYREGYEQIMYGSNEDYILLGINSASFQLSKIALVNSKTGSVIFERDINEKGFTFSKVEIMDKLLVISVFSMNLGIFSISAYNINGTPKWYSNTDQSPSSIYKLDNLIYVFNKSGFYSMEESSGIKGDEKSWKEVLGNTYNGLNVEINGVKNINKRHCMFLLSQIDKVSGEENLKFILHDKFNKSNQVIQIGKTKTHFQMLNDFPGFFIYKDDNVIQYEIQ